MNILHIDDNVYKHVNISKVLKSTGIGSVNIEWARNLDDAFTAIRRYNDSNEKLDLIITDMFYPEHPGSENTRSGDIFIKKMTEVDCKVPIIMCSTRDYNYPNIFGSVQYAEERNWEYDMTQLVRRLK